jgi:hypothetical protein
VAEAVALHVIVFHLTSILFASIATRAGLLAWRRINERRQIDIMHDRDEPT